MKRFGALFEYQFAKFNRQWVSLKGIGNGYFVEYIRKDGTLDAEIIEDGFDKAVTFYNTVCEGIENGSI